jgi:PAS domain S-box-containing protein
MRIKTRLLSNAFLPLLATIIILLVILAGYREETALQKQDRIIYEVRTGIFELGQLTHSYLLYREERPKRQWESLYRELTATLGGVELEPPARERLVGKVFTDLGVMRAFFLQLVSTFENDVDPTDPVLVEDLQARLLGQLMVRARILHATINELAFQVDEDRAALRRLNNNIIIATLLLLAIVLAATLLRMNRTIIDSLARLRRGTEIVGAGDLDHRLDFAGSDELSELAHTFDLMTEELQRTTVSRDKLRQSEERLRKSEASLRLATEATGLGIFDFHPPTGESEWSAFAKLHFGLPPGADVSYETFLSGLHPEDRGRVDMIVQRLLHQPASDGIYRTEYRTIGIVDKKERWLAASGRVFFNEKGEQVRFIGTTLDITERKRAEETLRQSEEKFRFIVDNIPDILFFQDQELRYVWIFNPPAPVQESQVIGRKDVDLLPAEEAKRLTEIKRRVLETGAGIRTELQLSPGGITRWYEAVYEPSRDPAGRIVGVVSHSRDITERKREEEERERLMAELARSNRDLEQFAYLASHDLQTPLRAVTGFLSLLARRYKGRLGPDADEYIDFAVKGAERMHQLINDILTFSRVGTRGKPFERLESREPLERSLDNLQAEIKESQAAVTFEELPMVTGDRDQLVQLFQNLVGNAIKYRKPEEPPRIHIAAEEVEDAWKFRVADTASASIPGMLSGSSRSFSGCTRLANTPAPASAWLSAGRLWSATAAASGWNRSRRKARPSISPCRRSAISSESFNQPALARPLPGSKRLARFFSVACRHQTCQAGRVEPVLETGEISFDGICSMVRGYVQSYSEQLLGRLQKISLPRENSQ